MMSHMAEPDALAEQAKLMEDYGAHCVYVTDSGGALDMDGVRARFEAYDRVLRPETQRGMHAHHNLSLGVANSIVAAQTGVVRIDASLAGMGRGCGQCAAGGFHRRRLAQGLASWLRPVWPDGRGRRDGASAAGPPGPGGPRNPQPGLCGVYSSFLRHAEKASADYGVDTREILVELGRRRMVGGQEDMIYRCRSRHRQGQDGRLGQEEKMGFNLQIALAAMTAGPPPFADTNFDVRLSPGPRNVGTRATSSGGGAIHVQLEGKRLILQGTYQGLLRRHPRPSCGWQRAGCARAPGSPSLPSPPAVLGSFSGQPATR